MNKEAALSILGLRGDEDRAGVTLVYGERLAVVQEQLGSAQTEVERNTHDATLAELSQAYELVTSTGRYANPDESGATVLRSDTLLLTPSPDAFVRMEPGVVIADRLEIGALLGEGGMGRVYAARDRLKAQDVAIKVLRHDLQFSNAAKERFLAEAKVSCDLSHPNIVRVHDVGIIGGTYYLSMERLKGHTLRQLMDRYRKEKRIFRLAEVTSIARQLIDALSYANRYIIHRDIKPENIWLTEDGTVKLMDFGIARAFSNSQMTQTGMMLGTAYYMSPEQHAGSKEIDWRTDQYALGVVLYELLTGTLPTGAVQPIEKVRRDLPKRFADALMRSMAPKPKKRFKSFDEMLVEIEAPKPLPVGRLLLITAVGVVALVSFNDYSWVLKLPALARALHAEWGAASARVAERMEPPRAGSADGSAFVGPPMPEKTPSTAPAVPPLDFVQESMPESESAGSSSTELQSGALESTTQESTSLDPATGGSMAPEAEASPQTPVQSNAGVVDATSQSEASPPAETNETTQSTSESSSSVASDIEARRNQCIAQCERDDCNNKAGESGDLCRNKLRTCRESCE